MYFRKKDSNQNPLANNFLMIKRGVEESSEVTGDC